MPTSNDRRFTLREKSWILYDWANSVYATNIMTAIFPILFVRLAGGAGDRWLSVGISIATFLVALAAPVLGAIADYQGMKKKLFTAAWLLGVAATALIAFAPDWRWMLGGFILSRIGFSASNLFYDSFLTDVTTDERMDRVSAWGYAMGYIGGSTIPFVASIAVLLVLGYDNPLAQKFAILITSAWWFVFTLPFLKNVQQAHYIQRPEHFRLQDIFRNIVRTARTIAGRRGLMLFVVAYFFYIDGVGTIINISTAYGTALGLGMMGMIIALLVTQVVAMPCSILFARLSQRITPRRALLFAIAVYMLICVVGFIMGYTLEPHQAAYGDAYSAYRAQALQTWDGPSEAAAKTPYRMALERYLSQGKAALLAKDAQAQLDTLAMDQKGLSAAEIERAQAAQQDLRQSLSAFARQNTAAIDKYRAAIGFSTILFWGMAILVGTVQGGIQAVSRSFFGKLIPKERSNEYFGFFDIFGKFASVLGPALYAAAGSLTGRSSWGTLAILALFLAGFVILLRAKKPLDALTPPTDEAAAA